VFKSHEELFQARQEIISAFERSGCPSAADRLRAGFAALSGLTDGWMSFLESVEDVGRRYGSQLGDPHRSLLAQIGRAAFEAVHRRPSGPWWRFW
jgi:hypothetical protein